jgi:hypothetical protein
MTGFTVARHWSQSWARWSQPTRSHSFIFWTVLILTYHLHVGSSNGLFTSGFPTKTPYNLTFPFSLPFTCLVRLFLFDFILIVSRKNKWWSLLCSFLRPHVTFCFLGPNIILSVLLSNTFTFPPLRVGEQISPPRTITVKDNSSIYILTSVFRYKRRR